MRGSITKSIPNWILTEASTHISCSVPSERMIALVNSNDQREIERLSEQDSKFSGAMISLVNSNDQRETERLSEHDSEFSGVMIAAWSNSILN